MRKNIGILHLSDIHASENNKETLKRLAKLLLVDIKKIKDEFDVDVDIVCITGDLIASGDNSDKEFSIVNEEVIRKVMLSEGIDESRIYIVPGNHEVKRSKIIDYIENGLCSTLTTENEIEKFMSGNISSAVERISYFQKDYGDIYGGDIIASNDFFHSHIIETKGLKIGIACINSAWRSSGKGKCEKTKMIIGKKTIIDSLESIIDSDLKICIFHHPLDWLVDDDKYEIEKCLGHFDIVLNGHIHANDTKSYITYNGIFLLNICGKFDNSSDVYNGYSLISINPYTNESTVILRKYLDYPRNCYDAAINLCDNGVYKTALKKSDEILALSYSIVCSILKNFNTFAKDYFVSNITADTQNDNYNDLFIKPIFNKYSEYEKETNFSQQDEEKEVFTVDDIFSNDKQNYLIMGKKEIGKSTLMRHITINYLSYFSTYRLVPILLDSSKILTQGKIPVEKACKDFIDSFCDPSVSFSIDQIKILLDNEKCVVLFDNYDNTDEKQHEKIDEFIERYPNNKYIFTETETIGARAIRDTPIVPACDCEKIFICTLSKEQIREIAKASLKTGSEITDTSIVDRVIQYLKKTALPKTPFVLSLLLSLCYNSDFSPINEVSVLERFIETILKKHSPEEVFSKTFDFKNKEDFLIYLVTKMNEQNKYFFTNEEFKELLDNYHKKIGFSVEETGFDTLFFSVGMLINFGNTITFRYSCIVEYYLAKKATTEPDFLSYIISDKNYLNYCDEILYYAGLHRKDLLLIQSLQAKLYSFFEKLRNKLTSLSNYNIGLDVVLPEDTFKQKLQEGRLTQHTSDKLSDTPDLSEKNLPENIDKKTDHSELNAFVKTLLLYGSCVKNLELLDYDIKHQGFTDFLLGLRLLLAILKENTENLFSEEIKLLESSEKSQDEQKLKNLLTFVNEMIKIALPLSIQQIALETIGTRKLNTIYDDIICNSNKYNNFEVFFCVFTICDLRLLSISKIKTLLTDYIHNTKDSSLLKIILSKLNYYYQFRFFGTVLDDFLLDTMAGIIVTINHKSKALKSTYKKQLMNRKDEKNK